MPREDDVQIRRGTTAEWAAANPVLDDGELGLDETLDILKAGDGVRPWLELEAVGDGETGILGFVSFDNDGVLVLRTSTNEVWSAIDAGATATIIAPASGKVLVEICVCAENMDINGCYLGVVNAAGVLYAGTAAEVTGSGVIEGSRITHTAIVTGLTPGNPYTLRPGFAGTPDGNIVVRINVPDPAITGLGGPVVMAVTALP